MIRQLLDLTARAKVYDLGQDFYVGMPHYPTHPPFIYGLTKKHGDYVLANGASSAADAIALGTHVGTHIDALCHFSCGGRLFGGGEVADAQSYGGGVQDLSIDRVDPILRRGVLLDIAGLEQVDALPAGFAVMPEHLESAEQAHGVRVQAGDVVLLRTGWGRYWNDAARYINDVKGPGPEIDGARWLSGRNVFAAGADTVAFERVPSPTLPVHVHLLVERGIHIIEGLNLEQAARERVHEFLFVALPLKIRGATGSPIRPLAISL